MSNNSWKAPVCNLCDCKEFNVIYDNMMYWEYEGKFRIVECSNCSLRYTNPRPPLSEIGRYYKQDNYFGRNIEHTRLAFDDKKEREGAYGPIYRLILTLKKNGKILDIGAGTGLFLSKFKDLGWMIEGVELSEDAQRYAKKHYGIKLKRGDFFDFVFRKNSFHVVTLNGALEHMYDPLKVLKIVRDLIKKGGILVFSVPNSESFGRYIFGKKWFPWQPPRHLYHFSPETVSKILRLSGFQTFKIEYNYWLQNQYILFQSLRYGYSPRFQKKIKSNNHDISENRSIKKELGKFVGILFSFSLAFVEPFFKRGEVMIVYAKK